MRQVLFVCTGNIFRSLTAEYALRLELGPRAGDPPHRVTAYTGFWRHSA